jgi:ribonuclease HII
MVAMRQAVQALPRRAGVVLVDGQQVPSGLEGYVVQAVVGGDSRSAAVAAASVLAKVGRELVVV